MYIAKFLRTAFFIVHLLWLLLYFKEIFGNTAIRKNHVYQISVKLKITFCARMNLVFSVLKLS